MKSKNLKHLRRTEFAQAAFETLCEYGYSGTTVDRVAKHAGVSKTNILHYFGNKTSLLEAALRYGNSVLVDEVRALMVRSKTPWERVYAVLFANFSRQTFTQEAAHAWLSLCAEVPHNPDFQRIQTVIHGRMRSNLMHALQQITDPKRAEDAASLLSSTIDGLWLRLAVQPNPLSIETALGQIETLLEGLFPNDENRLAARNTISEIQQILSPR